VDPASTNGSHPSSNGASPGPNGGIPSDSGSDAAPGCAQLPGLLLRLIFWLGLLVVVIWLLVVFLTTVL